MAQAAAASPSGAPLLEIEHLAYRAGDTPILRDVSLALRAGELVAIMGASGSGKTTLLRCVNRLSEPTGGTIRLEGADAGAIAPVELRRRVGMVAQLPFMFDGSIRDNLLRAAEFSGLELPDADGARLLGDVGLDESLDRDAGRLSVGQQQRVAMARALVARPSVLLCDEPTAALDRDSSRHLEATLHRLADGGMAILLVTHDAAQAARVAGRRLRLADGTLDGVADDAGVTGA